MKNIKTEELVQEFNMEDLKKVIEALTGTKLIKKDKDEEELAEGKISPSAYKDKNN